MHIQTTVLRRSLLLFALILTTSISLVSQVIVTNNPPIYGPYNGSFYVDGAGLKKPLVEKDTVMRPDLPWSLYGWVNATEAPKGLMLLAGVGDPSDEYGRYLAVENGKLILWVGNDNSLVSSAGIVSGKWQFVAATFDGSRFHIFSDGAEVGSGTLISGTASGTLQLAPARMPWPGQTFVPEWQHFGGKIAGLTLVRRAINPDEMKQISQQPPDFARVEYEEGSKPWPVQTRGQAGYRAPQDPSTWPVSRAPFSKPVAKPLPKGPEIQETGANEWTLSGGWSLAEAPKVSAAGTAISQPQFDARNWWAATVPGTVLTTMIDRGVYPDPDYGLNNLAIPESLNKQDYWYRNEFKAPKTGPGQKLTLTFQGINYKAAVWLNGQFLGTITGAFIRGVFDVTDILKPGQTNVLAQWTIPRNDHWCIHPWHVRCHRYSEARTNECFGGPHFAAPTSGNSA